MMKLRLWKCDRAMERWKEEVRGTEGRQSAGFEDGKCYGRSRQS